MPQVVEIQALPKQIDFLRRDDVRFLLYSGAFGAGKTRAVCLKTVMRAVKRGAREGLCRKHLVTLKATTLKTLLEPEGKLPPVLPPGTYEHNKSEKVIRIKGGGEIVYFGLDEPEKIGSYNLSGCGIDEAVELNDADYTMLDGRVRLDVDMTRQLYGACNPGAPSHFLAERFGLGGGHQCKPNHYAVQTTAIDNFFLPKDYLDNLQTFTGVSYKRYVQGLWVGGEGLVYDNWDREVFVRVRKDLHPTLTRVIVGQDEGYTNPAVLLVIQIDHDGRMHVAEEWYKSKQMEPSVISQAQLIYDEWQPERFVIDPSAAKLIANMRAHGLPVMEADNDVFGGIQAVQKRLHVAGDGRPRLTVDPRCVNTIREFESYEWKPTEKHSTTYRDEPVKANDHALDALRYAVVSEDGLGGKWDTPDTIEREFDLSWSGETEGGDYGFLPR